MASCTLRESPSLARSKTQLACLMHSISSSSPATPSRSCAEGASKRHWGTAGTMGIPSIRSAISHVSRHKLTLRQQERLLRNSSTDGAHISVELAYNCARQVRGVFLQDTPAQGRTWPSTYLSAYQRVPCPELRARTRPYASGRVNSWLLLHRQSQERPDRSHEQHHELGGYTASGY